MSNESNAVRQLVQHAQNWVTTERDHINETLYLVDKKLAEIDREKYPALYQTLVLHQAGWRSRLDLIKAAELELIGGMLDYVEFHS